MGKENHINKLTPRKLSLLGKTIILNTLKLAKTANLSNVFPIPQNILTQIHKNIFNYLWQNKKEEPIARKALFLQKEKGGLNIKEPEAHKLSMRLKHLLNLKENEKQPPWTYIAKYWLAKYFYNYSQD